MMLRIRDMTVMMIVEQWEQGKWQEQRESGFRTRHDVLHLRYPLLRWEMLELAFLVG